MTYTGAMVLPQNAVRMNTNEMRYVEGGGWDTYRGKEALAKLTVLAGQAYSGYVAAAKLGSKVAVVSATGWGLVAGVAGALGVGLCISYGTVQAAMFANALYYYKKDKAFKLYNLSIWSWTATLGVKRAS